MSWYVIYHEDSPDGGKTPGRLHVSSREFLSWGSAHKYAKGVSPSRKPRIVVEVAAQLEGPIVDVMLEDD